MRLKDKFHFLFQIGWRNIWRQKKRSFLIVSAAAVGILGILFAMAFLNGITQSLLSTAIDSGLGHLQIRPQGFHEKRKWGMFLTDADEMEKKLTPWRRQFAPRMEREGIIRLGSQLQGLQVLGIDPEKEPGVSFFHKWLVAGKYLHENTEDDCLLGWANAQKLEVQVNDYVILTIGDKNGDSISRKLRIQGIFKSPAEPIDKYTLLISRSMLSKMYQQDSAGISYFVIREPRKDELIATQKSLEKALGAFPSEVLTYRQLEPALTRMLDLSDKYIYIFYLILMAGFALILFDTILISVLERSYEIGLLRALGTSRSLVFFMILIESFWLTLLGVLVGIGLGAGLISYFSEYGLSLAFFSKGMELMGKSGNTIYPYLDLNNLANALLLGLSTSVLAALYPAGKAVKSLPVDALSRKK